jgi:hypothetical protein
LEDLTYPPFKIGTLGGRTLQFFTFSLAILGVLVAGFDRPTWSELVQWISLFALLSVLMAVLWHGALSAAVMIRRGLVYDELLTRSRAMDQLLANAKSHLANITRSLPIHAISDNGQGTVRLAFSQLASTRLTEATTIELVRGTSNLVLGLAQVVAVNDEFAFAEPVDRADPDFWEGLEDRMKRDFTPPADVFGRALLWNHLIAAELLSILQGEGHER